MGPLVQALAEQRPTDPPAQPPPGLGPDVARSTDIDVLFLVNFLPIVRSAVDATTDGEQRHKILETAAQCHTLVRMSATRDFTVKLAMAIFGILANVGLIGSMFKPELYLVPSVAIVAGAVVCAGCVAVIALDKATTQALLGFFSKSLPKLPAGKP